MKTGLRGWTRVLGVLLLLLTSLLRASGAAAQEDEAAGVTDNTYTSPSFGYTFEWDDSVWSVVEASSEGEDFIQLQSDSADFYVEGIYYYAGDPQECVDGELAAIAEQDGIDELPPLVDENDEPIVSSDDTSSSGLFEETVDLDDGSTYDGAVYLECQTLVPNSAVLIITAAFSLDDADEQITAVQDILDTFTLEVGAAPTLDSSDIEVIARLAASDIDSFWTTNFAENGETYVRPKYITFSGPVETACGEETSGEAGPFYCPGDETVYLDIDSLTAEYVPLGVVVLEAVIAHEVGHHVQSLLGLDGCADPDCGEPGGSLAIELQADCFAGAWTQDAADRGVIQASDVKRIDAAITKYYGDPPDTPNDDPEAHGSGELRKSKFDAGYKGGLEACGLS